jgi:hypothetical protein
MQLRFRLCDALMDQKFPLPHVQKMTRIPQNAPEENRQAFGEILTTPTRPWGYWESCAEDDDEPSPEEIERLARIDMKHPANRKRKYLLPCAEVDGQVQLVYPLDPAKVKDSERGLKRALKRQPLPD